MRPNLQSTIPLALSLHLFFSTGNAEAQGYEVLPWPAARSVPGTTGVDLQGKPQSWLPLRGRAVLINFWASWCEPCVAELPSLQAVANQYGTDTVVVLAVNFKESAPSVQRFMSRTTMPTAVTLDRDGSIARAWGVNVFPTTVLIGADGQVKSWVRGSLDWQSPQGIDLVASLLASQTR